MHSRIIESNPKMLPRLAPVFVTAREQLRHLDPQPPSELTGDLLLAVGQPRFRLLENKDLTRYGGMFASLSRGHRWGYLVSRLGQMAHQARGKVEIWEGVMIFLGERLTDSLWKTAQTNSEVSCPVAPVDKVLEHIAMSYAIHADEYEDFSEPLLDDLTMVMTEFSRRLILTDFKDLLQHKDLVEACLKIPCDLRPYNPRYLCEILKPGDRDERLPGDHFGLRGVTKKIREDQIPKVLPSELAGWHWNGAKGRHLTLDRLVNGAPPCYENYDTRRPEVDHRMLLVYLVNTPHDLGMDLAGSHFAFGASEPPASGAEVTAKALAYALLVNAALKVPHHAIRTDVAWFQRDDSASLEYQWGVAFPLKTVKFSSSEDANWRNLVEADRFLPLFLVRQAGAMAKDVAPNSVALREQPADYLQRPAVADYDAVFITLVGHPQNLVAGLPAGVVVGSKLPTGLPSVLLISADDEASPDHQLRGQTFRDLFTAQMAPVLLEGLDGVLPPEEKLIEIFLEMIVGPIELLTQSKGGRF